MKLWWKSLSNGKQAAVIVFVFLALGGLYATQTTEYKMDQAWTRVDHAAPVTISQAPIDIADEMRSEVQQD